MIGIPSEGGFIEERWEGLKDARPAGRPGLTPIRGIQAAICLTVQPCQSQAKWAQSQHPRLSFPTTNQLPSGGSQSGSTSLPAFKTMFLPTNMLRLSDLVPRQKSTLRTQPLSTRLFGNTNTFVMEPLERTVVVVTTHHIPK